MMKSYTVQDRDMSIRYPVRANNYSPLQTRYDWVFSIDQDTVEKLNLFRFEP
jgi:hypothetical protein